MASRRDRRLHREILDRLMARIVDGSIPPGAMLPREVDLVEEHGVSRGVARETIRALEERDLISVTHGIGAFVNDGDQWDTAHPDVLQALAVHEPEALVRECKVCWAPLVETAAREAAIHTPAERLPSMWTTLAHLDRYASGSVDSGFRKATAPFYIALFQATGNRPLKGFGMRLLTVLSAAPSPPTEPYFVQTELTPQYRKLMSSIQSAQREEARDSAREILRLEDNSPAAIAVSSAR